MSKKLLFIQPIVSHYRKSVVEEIVLLEPQSFFWGTNKFQGVDPLMDTTNVYNGFKTKRVKVFGVKFIWYNNLFQNFFKDKSDYIILSGINPLLIQTFLIFIYAKLFTSKRVYWWSQGKKFRQGFFGKKIRFVFYHYSNGVFLYSEEGRTNFLMEGLPRRKLHVINNCLNYEDYGWLNYNFKNEIRDSFRVVYTGRLSERKKVIVLLKAIKLLKENGHLDIYIDIIGDGDQMLNLENYIRDNNLKNLVSLHGAKYGADVHEYLLGGDLVVCPGAVGLSIVHALSFGLPFITSEGDPDHSSELELLNVGFNGDYFLLDNVESLVDKILIWRDKLKMNKGFYQNNCVQTVIEHEYLPNLVAQKLINSL